MMKYDDACSQVGYDQYTSNEPKSEYKFFAYKNGEVKEFPSRKEAESYSDNIERVLANKAEVEDYWHERQELANKASEIWHAALRNEYIHLSDAVYSICYGKAYDYGHSSGYDEVAGKMIDIVDMAEQIIAATKVGA